MTGPGVLAGLLAALAVLAWPWPSRSGPSRSGPAGAGRARWERLVGRARAVPGGRRSPARPQGGRPGRRRGDEEWVADLAEVTVVGLRAGLDLPAAVRVAVATPSVARAAPWLPAALEGRLVPMSSVLDAGPPGGAGAAALEVLGRAWRLSEETGAPAAHTTAAAAQVVRARAAARRRLAAALAGPRASMRLLTLLPLAGPGAVLLLGLDLPDLLRPHAARASLGAGVCLTVVGRVWARALVERASRPGTTAG